MRSVAARFDRLSRRFAHVRCVGAEMLRCLSAHHRSFRDHRVERLLKQLHVVPIGAVDDDRQRDATAVHQQAAFGSIFSPDPLGCAPRTPAPAALCSWPHRCFATPRRCRPDRRTRPAPHATASQTSRRPPIAGSICGWRLRSRTPVSVRLSIGSRYVTRRRSPRTPCVPATAFCRRRACAGMPCLLREHAQESAVPREPRTRPIPSSLLNVVPISNSLRPGHHGRRRAKYLQFIYG